MKKVLWVLLLVSASSLSASAQCAMCKATLENNISNGQIGIAAGINFGILYLFVAPYLAISVIAYFWYKTSRRNAHQFDKGGLAG